MVLYLILFQTLVIAVCMMSLHTNMIVVSTRVTKEHVQSSKATVTTTFFFV